MQNTVKQAMIMENYQCIKKCVLHLKLSITVLVVIKTISKLATNSKWTIKRLGVGQLKIVSMASFDRWII